MSAAAAKRTVLAAATLAALAALSTLVSAGGATSDRRDREAPTAPTNIRVMGVTATTVRVAWEPSRDNVGVEGYYVHDGDGKAVNHNSKAPDDKDAATVDEPEITLKELRCGQSTEVNVVAFDAARNRSDRAKTTVTTAACPDVRPPTPPSGFRQAATSANAVVLAWAPSTDDAGVVEYGVYRLLNHVATIAEPTVTLTALACGSSYEYAVDAADAAGNRSPRARVFVQTSSCPPPPSGDSTPPSTPTNVAFDNVAQSALTVTWTRSTDNVSVSAYDLYRNGGKVASVTTTTASQSGLICGTSFEFEVAARDAAGNTSQRARGRVSTSACPPPSPSPDTTPPSVPSGLAASNLTSTGVTLRWNASTDNVAVAGYDLYRNGAKVDSVAATSASQSGLTCGTSYELGVAARDAAGNASAQTKLTAVTSACAAPPPPTDTTPPSVPSGLAASNLTSTGVTLRWNASTDNVAVAGYDLYRNGAKVDSVAATSASQSGLTCGTSYELGVAARDAAGNASAQTKLTAVTSACAAPPPPTDTTPPSVPANLRVASVTRSTASLSWSPSTDNVAVAGYEAFVDSAWRATTVQPGATVSNLSCGTAYTFEVVAFDMQGNESQRARATGSTAACADTQAPATPPNLIAASRTTTSIALSWSASTDNVGVVGYGLYRGGTSVGTSSTTTGIFSGLQCNTNHTLAIDAYDAAGNRSEQAVVMVSTTACPDTTPPSTPTGLAASSVTPTSLILSWDPATDNVAVTGYDVYRNGTKMATVTAASSAQSGLSCGTSYTFGVIARDAAGNSSQLSQRTASTSACAVTGATPYFVADYANGTFGAPWTTLFSYTSPGYQDVGLYGSPPRAQTPDGRVAVVPAPGSSGNAARMEIRDADPGVGGGTLQKSEVRTVSQYTFDKPGGVSVGDVRWFSTRLYLPYTSTEKFEWARGGTNDFTSLMDIHPGSNSASPAFSLSWYPSSASQWATLKVKGGDPAAGAPHYPETINLWQLTDGSGNRVQANHNRWIDFVWGMRFAPDSTGWLEVWVDGANVYPRKNRPTMWSGDSGQYLKQGLYKMKDASFPNGRSVVYFGRTTIGLSRPF